MGACSNFEGGPSALAAGLTARTPRYGYHLNSHRVGSMHFALRHQPTDLADWGALGGIVGRATNGYWQVPVVTIKDVPNSDQLKHFGAALASFGSVAMFHMPGVTPEAPTLREAFRGRAAPPATAVGRDDLEAFYAAQGAAFAELPMVDRFETGCPTTLIRTGDELHVEPARGLVTILNRA
jgi:predicted aconitase